MICPLMRGRENVKIGYCAEKECMFTDKSGKCLIKQALQCYIEKTHLENEEKKTFTKTYTGKPYQFLEPGDTSPAKLLHGGVYEDMSPYYDNGPLRPRTIIPAPNADDEWHPGVSSKDPLY